MAPDAPAGKRKRGRPRLGQNNKQPADASGSQHVARRDGDDDVEGEGAQDRPRKRGKVTEETAASPSPMDAQPPWRGRTRRSLGELAPQQQQQQARDEPLPEPPRNGRKRQQTRDVPLQTRDEPLQTRDEPLPEPSRNGPKRQQEPRAQPQEPAKQPQDTQPETVSHAPRTKRRRGQEQQARRRESTEKQPATKPEAPDKAPPRKGGRRSLRNRGKDISLDQDTSQVKAPTARGKRRPSPAQEHQENEVDDGENEVDDGESEVDDGENEVDDRENEVDDRENEQEPASGPRNRVQPSHPRPSPSQARNDSAERRKKSKRPSQAQERDERSQKKTRSRGAATAAEPSKRRRSGPQPESPVIQTRDPKRRRSRQHIDQDGAAPDSPSGPPPSPPKPYVHVVPHVRRVRQSTIAAKWSPLTGPSLSTVSALLHLAHQPILQRLSTTHQRREHASAALRLMASRISRKLAARGLPFPPASMPAAPRPRGGQQQQQQSSDGGRETELDFESVLDAKAALEALLGPTAHAVELLRRERDGVGRELERDYETLRQLESRARLQAREQRGLLKKAHALTPLAMMPEQPHDARAGASVFTPAATSSDNLFTGLATAADVDDGGLRQLAVQLAGHVESMRVNLRQADGLAPQLARARAALQATLLAHLDPDQYERVVLG